MTKAPEHDEVIWGLIFELFRVSAREATTIIDYHTRIELFETALREWIDEVGDNGNVDEENAAASHGKKNGAKNGTKFSFADIARILNVAPSTIHRLRHLQPPMRQIAVGFPFTIAIVLQKLASRLPSKGSGTPITIT